MLTLALCRHICERILRLCHMETNTSFDDDERGRTDGKRRQKVRRRKRRLKRRLFSRSIIRAKRRRRRRITQKTPLITRSKKDDRFGTHFCLSLSLSSKWKDFELTHIYTRARARVFSSTRAVASRTPTSSTPRSSTPGTTDTTV